MKKKCFLCAEFNISCEDRELIAGNNPHHWVLTPWQTFLSELDMIIACNPPNHRVGEVSPTQLTEKAPEKPTEPVSGGATTQTQTLWLQSQLFNQIFQSGVVFQGNFVLALKYRDDTVSCVLKHVWITHTRFFEHWSWSNNMNDCTQ